MSTHGVLTESSVSRSLRTPIGKRKGREGKGRGRVVGHAYNLTVGIPHEAPCMAATAAEIGGQTCQ